MHCQLRWSSRKLDLLKFLTTDPIVIFADEPVRPLTDIAIDRTYDLRGS